MLRHVVAAERHRIAEDPHVNLAVPQMCSDREAIRPRHGHLAVAPCAHARLPAFVHLI